MPDGVNVLCCAVAKRGRQFGVSFHLMDKSRRGNDCLSAEAA